MMIPLSVPNICGNELNYVTQAITDGWVSSGGPSINKFEDEFASYSGAEFTAACQSGTAAIHLALVDAGVGAGDLVAVPSLTFIGSVNPVRYVGAEPVFMDCDDSLCLDPAKFEQYLDEDCERRGDGYWYDVSLGKPVKAVIAVHVYGNAVDMERMTGIAASHNLLVIENATDAMGTFYTSGAYAGKMAGTIGDYGVFSFNSSKIITCGGGGMLTSPDPARVRRMRHLAAQAKTNDLYFTYDAVGFNYRMTNVQAAIGLAQLEQLESFIEAKRANYELYRKHGIELLPFSEYCRPNYAIYSYLCEGGGGFASGELHVETGESGLDGHAGGAVERVQEVGGKINAGGDGMEERGCNGAGGHLCSTCFVNGRLTRDKLIRYLLSRNIQTRPVWALCHEQPMYSGNKAYKIEKARKLQASIINLPCGSSLTPEEVSNVAAEIKAFYKSGCMKD